MDSQQLEPTVSTEMCSTNFYVTFGKDEIFNCQMTIRGNPTEAQLRSHIKSAIQGMQIVLEMHGHAKPQRGEASSQAASSSAPVSQFEFYKGAKGKTFIKIPPGQAEPNEITCPIHDKRMKRNANDRGVWFSHKDGESWCSVAVPDKSS